jgi:hypothetical protein
MSDTYLQKVVEEEVEEELYVQWFHAIFAIILWVGVFGLVESIMTYSKLTIERTIFVYVMLILITFPILYTKGREGISYIL